MSAIPAAAPALPKEHPGPKPVLAPPKRPNRSWIGVLVVLAIAALGVWGYRVMTKPVQPAVAVAAVKTAKAAVGPMEITLQVSGQTSARNFANITAPLLRGPEARASLILLELAKPGTLVKKGQVVARIDAQSAQDHIDDLKDTLAAAENDIRKRVAEQKVEWEGMQQTLRVAKSNFDKAKLDYQAAEVKTDLERELLRLSMDEYEKRYTQQQNDIATRKASQAAEIRILELTLARHQQHMSRHAHDLEKYTVQAPMDGLAVMAALFRGGEMTQIQQGDQVFPGQQILKIVDTRTMQVEGSVSQADSGDLRLAQMAKIGFDAFPEMKFAGKVYSIGALAVGGWRQGFFIRSIPVRVQIGGADPKLIPDLSAHANVTLETLSEQLQIPVGAVQQENGKTWVQVKRGEQFERREVRLGKRNNLNVAVTSGLQAGDEVRLM